MKRAISILLAAAVMLSLAACARGNKPGTSAEPTQDAVNTAAIGTGAPAETPTAQIPEGYDEYDFTLLRDFFEQKDGEGVTNGAKCFPNYDPNDPASWNDGSAGSDNAVIWDGNGKVSGVNISGSGDEPIRLAGRLTVSSFTALKWFDTWNAVFDEVEAKDIPTADLMALERLKFPLVGGEASFSGAYVDRIEMRSAVHTLVELTGETEEATYALPSFRIEINIDGEGYAGVNAWSDENFYEVRLSAEPVEGRTFAGWFDANGNKVSDDVIYELFGEASGNSAVGAHADFVFIARFA